jgi:regulator of RNase E activity RraA
MFGDIDGVLVIPQERAIEVLRLAEEHAATETRARAEFADPTKDAEEVYGRYKKL